jgi:hypothetical protein
MRNLRPARRELLASLLVFVLLCAALTALRANTQPHYRLSPRQAVAAARANPADAAVLAHHRTTSERVVPFDNHNQAVTFFDGPHIVLYAVVGPDGVTGRQVHLGGYPQQGPPLANSWWVLTLMSTLFLLAAAVVPLRRIRNLDALALAGFTANIAAVNAGLVSLSVLLSVPLLVYLGARCLLVALRAPAPQPEQVALLRWVSARMERPERLRLTALLTGAALLATTVITLTSTHVSAEAVASLSGATDLLHWTLPYGHIHYIVHGDTYPLLNYILYVPGALLGPVSNPFDSTAGALPVAAVASLVTAAALWVLARRRLRCGQMASMGVVLAWAVFPPVLLTAAGGNDDVVLAAILAWMLVLLASSSRSLLALTAAIWTKVVPLILLPLWFVRKERMRAREVVPAVLVSLVLCGYLVALGGPGSVTRMIADIWFPFHRGSLYAPWYAFSVEWLQPLVQAAVLALLAWVLLRLRRDPSPWADTARAAGIFATFLLGAQIAANQWTFTYLAWVYPFIAIALLVDRPPSRATTSAADAELVAPTAAGAKQLQPA